MLSPAENDRRDQFARGALTHAQRFDRLPRRGSGSSLVDGAHEYTRHVPDARHHRHVRRLAELDGATLDPVRYCLPCRRYYAAEGLRVAGVERLGKLVVIALDDDRLFLVAI